MANRKDKIQKKRMNLSRWGNDEHYLPDIGEVRSLFLRNSGYDLIPRCPGRARSSANAFSTPNSGSAPRRFPSAAISLEAPLSVDRDTAESDEEDVFEVGSFSASASLSGGFAYSQRGSEGPRAPGVRRPS